MAYNSAIPGQQMSRKEQQQRMKERKGTGESLTKSTPQLIDLEEANEKLQEMNL